jgi:hypothetical protein
MAQNFRNEVGLNFRNSHRLTPCLADTGSAFVTTDPSGRFLYALASSAVFESTN